MANPIIVIPSRMASTRLPNKPLADINGDPMIVQVLRRAQEADIGRVVVAAAEEEIAEAVIKAGGEAVLTNPNHPSGSDRVFEALKRVDPDEYHDLVVNLQGDLPTIDVASIKATLEPLMDSQVDISTLAVKITREEERDNPNVVKAVVALRGERKIGRALYFTRAMAPYGDGPLYHHIGIYGYRRSALNLFVALDPSPLELREKLEQLRALEAGLRVDVAIVDTVPLGVDTPEDLERARKILSA
jgi:3-deoxy-manno-octulosonate cytidylyltransferase (CMP-KDO synthetase)